MKGVYIMLNIYKIIIYLGIIAFILLSIVFLLGITQNSFNLHYYTAILAFIFACFHPELVVFRNLKEKREVKQNEKKYYCFIFSHPFPNCSRRG